MSSPIASKLQCHHQAVWYVLYVLTNSQSTFDRRPVDRKREGTTWVGEASPSPVYIWHCLRPSPSIHIQLSIYLCTTTADHTCTLLLNGTRWSSANNNWTRHCIAFARCRQARPVRFHGQAQGYMFHDAGTNVKLSGFAQKSIAPHFSFSHSSSSSGLK